MVYNLLMYKSVLKRVVRKLIPRKNRFQTINFVKDVKLDKSKLSPSYVHDVLTSQQRPVFSLQQSDIDKQKLDAKNRLWKLVCDLEPPKPTEFSKIWSAEDSKGIYEKLICTGEYGSLIPMYRCIPNIQRRSRAWIICLQGHNSGMHNSLGVDYETERFYQEPPKDSNFVDWCFRNGFSALCIEQRCFGNRKENEQAHRSAHPCHDAALKALLLGRTLMGERILDVRIGINVIKQCKDPKVEDHVIGVMGNSLGGTVSIYANALLSDIDFAIAGSCVSSFEKSVLGIYHCADLYIPRIREYFEFADVAGLAAPKPLVIVQGGNDPIFPIDGMQEAVTKLEVIYAQCGAKNNLVVKIGDRGHRFYQDLATEGIEELGDKI